ncbi:MAG: PAS domain-containing protein [Anaerolineae bacterium]|nr:PAS domain-containing protein [Anaerolineae bacterium]
MADTPPISQHSVESLVKYAGLPIITTDARGAITGFNPSAEELYEIAERAMLGVPFAALAPGLRRSEHEQVCAYILETGRGLKLITEHLTGKGAAIPVRLALSPLKDNDGLCVGLCCISIDLRERNAVLRDLEHERDLLEAILETTNDAIIMIDAAGQVVIVNLPFESVFRLPRYEVVNRPVDALADVVRIRPDLPAELANLVLTFGSDPHQSAGGDLELKSVERRILNWYTAPVHAHDGSAMGRLFVFRDATQERDADRMKTEFVSLVSHELRTPLTSVMGFAELMLDGDAGDISPTVRSYLEIIRFNAERLTSLISDILDLTRIDAGRIELRPAWNDLCTIVTSVLQSLEPVIGSHRQPVHVDVPPDLPALWCDSERMAQIMSNLVTNASKYSPEGAPIHVRASLLRRSDGASLPASAPEGVADRLPSFLICVQDSGMGIAPEDHSRVFTRFFRSENAARHQVQGSGLGLNIVRSFVELHGGVTWLESQLGQGTSVYFTVPYVEGA